MVRNKKMNKENEFSIQAKRLMKFFESTGYSVNGFAQECNIPSTRTMTQIFTGGRPPSRKVLGKIIARFPALNHDWVILGYGEMIIPGMTNQASGNSVLKSKGAAFQQISDKQIETSFGINELARKVEQAMALNAQTTQILTNKVEQMAIAIKDAQISLLEEQSKRSVLFQKTKEEHVALIKELNEKREEKMASEFFKLSDKVRSHLEKSKDTFIELFDRKLDNGIILINEEMNKNAIIQTELAINSFMENFTQEKILSKIGKHSLNKKP